MNGLLSVKTIHMKQEVLSIRHRSAECTACNNGCPGCLTMVAVVSVSFDVRTEAAASLISAHQPWVLLEIKQLPFAQ